MLQKSLHFSLAGGPKKCQNKICTFHVQEVRKNAKRKFTLFTCGVHTFHLQGVTLFTCRGQDKCQRKFALFTRRGHTFHLQVVRKNAKRKFTLFIYRELEKMLAFFGPMQVKSVTLCEWKISCQHWQQTRRVSVQRTKNWNYPPTQSANKPWLGESSLWWTHSPWIRSSSELSLFSSAWGVVNTSTPSRLRAPRLELPL